MRAPFPYFGGKRLVADLVWERFGAVKQYIEPFCGSAAVLLAAPTPAPLEVIGDVNGFIANFWRAVVHDADAVARWADYPVSHIDIGARHTWLMARRDAIGAGLQNAEWPGDAQAAGWWLWGQCAWIGAGWCKWEKGQIPHVSNAGQGIQAGGQIPHVSNAGQGIQAGGQIPHVSNAGMWTGGGDVALRWLRQLAARLGRVRVIHGAWDRTLNHHYGGAATGVFLDPPYRGFEALYHADSIADAVCEWARDHGDLRVCIAGHRGDYDLPGWDVVEWSRGSLTYGSRKTTSEECLWFSPACRPSTRARQQVLL